MSQPTYLAGLLWNKRISCLELLWVASSYVAFEEKVSYAQIQIQCNINFLIHFLPVLSQPCDFIFKKKKPSRASPLLASLLLWYDGCLLVTFSHPALLPSAIQTFLDSWNDLTVLSAVSCAWNCPMDPSYLFVSFLKVYAPTQTHLFWRPGGCYVIVVVYVMEIQHILPC